MHVCFSPVQIRGMNFPHHQPLSSALGGHAHELSRNVEEILMNDERVAAVTPQPELAGFSCSTTNSEQVCHMHIILADPTGLR
jgi:hypothetical protein